MKLRLKAPLIVITISIITSFFLGYSSYNSNVRLIESAKQRELQTVATLIQNSIQEQTNKAAARASLVANLPSIQEAFRNKDRDQLIKRLVPAFLIQREQFGVREGQFHLAPATSYLRVFDVTAPQEDLSGFREMVLAANRQQEVQKGVEVGRRGLSIRGIYVVKDADGPIGSFEVGMSFSTVLEDIKKNMNFEAGVFIDNKLMSTIATEIPKPDSERIIGDFLNVEATNWQVVRSFVSSDILNKANDVTFRVENVKGIDYGMTIVPVLDFKGSQIGSVVAVRNFENFHIQTKAALVNTLAFSLLQAALLVGAVLIVFNGMVMRPVTGISEKIALLAKGDTNIEMGELAKNQNEVGEIARSIEALRKTLAKKLEESKAMEKE